MSPIVFSILSAAELPLFFVQIAVLIVVVVQARRRKNILSTEFCILYSFQNIAECVSYVDVSSAASHDLWSVVEVESFCKRKPYSLLLYSEKKWKWLRVLSECYAKGWEPCRSRSRNRGLVSLNLVSYICHGKAMTVRLLKVGCCFQLVRPSHGLH